MKFIRSKLFILGYLGNLLLIVATFVPIIKFNNQIFAFVDQFFYLSLAIVLLSTICLVLITIKKYKIALIPTIINIIIIIYGIYNIFTIDGLDDIQNVENGIAVILYPIGILLSIVGNILTKPIPKENTAKKELINPKNLNTVEINTVEEPKNIESQNNIPNQNINLNFDEQIPLSQILKKEENVNSLNIQENTNNIEQPIEPIKDISNNDIPNIVNENIALNNNQNKTEIDNINITEPIGDIINNEENNVIPNIVHEDISINDNQDGTEITNVSVSEPIQNTNNTSNIMNVSNQDIENKHNEIINDNSDTKEEIKQVPDEIKPINIVQNIEENLIQNNNSNQEKENLFFSNQNNEQKIVNNDSINEIIDINNKDTEIFMSDIIEKPQSSPLEETRTNTTEFEIPDLSQSNDMMMNHTQIMDKPKQEFMAINPSDIKIDTKKPLFKKKEKDQKVEDPLEKIMKRDIPRTLGRTCQFCNTPLGDDERICPLCGRIN